MKAIVFLPTQGPHLPRKGPAEAFDWRAQCRVAAALQRGLDGSVIYVPSGFQQAGSPSELEFYGGALREAGVPDEALMLEPRGLDTIEQCDLATALAQSENARLVVVSCRVHFRRVRYLLKDHEVEHVIVDGVPSRWLQFTHIVLGVMFPVLDALGLRAQWRRYVNRRREKGRQ